MLDISTTPLPPMYTALIIFQDTLELNVVEISSYDIDLGRRYLVMKPLYFTTENGAAYTQPKNHGITCTSPTRIATRYGSSGYMSTTTSTYPFTVVETTRQFSITKMIYHAMYIVHICLKNLIINGTENTYITDKKYVDPKHATVIANKLIHHL